MAIQRVMAQKRGEVSIMGLVGAGLQSPTLGFVWPGSLMSLFQQWDRNQLSEQHKPGVIFSTDVTF